MFRFCQHFHHFGMSIRYGVCAGASDGKYTITMQFGQQTNARVQIKLN